MKFFYSSPWDISDDTLLYIVHVYQVVYT